MIITSMPYQNMQSIVNDVNISYHFYPEGDNTIVLKHGNIPDPDKMVTIASESLTAGNAKIIQIEGNLTKYLHIAITGDPNIEMVSHSKRNPN